VSIGVTRWFGSERGATVETEGSTVPKRGGGQQGLIPQETLLWKVTARGLKEKRLGERSQSVPLTPPASYSLFSINLGVSHYYFPPDMSYSHIL